MRILGLDVGGTGIKSAIIETDTGELVDARQRVGTPQPALPASLAAAIHALIRQHQWCGPVGMGFPAAIRQGVARTAANIDPGFIGLPVADYFSRQTGCPIFVLNDADAAGIAEMRFGAGRGNTGVVLLVTLGTGLGTALFSGGQLLPNTELGHLFLANGLEAERYAAESVRVREGLDWDDWGARLNLYLNTLEKLFWPDLIILGGGVSRKLEKFAPALTLRTPVVAARLQNQAGIVGAALFAEESLRRNVA